MSFNWGYIFYSTTTITIITVAYIVLYVYVGYIFLSSHDDSFIIQSPTLRLALMLRSIMVASSLTPDQVRCFLLPHQIYVGLYFK